MDVLDLPEPGEVVRAHTATEFEGLCSGVEAAPGYRFEVGELPFGPGVITWVLGLPGVGRLEGAA